MSTRIININRNQYRPIILFLKKNSGIKTFTTYVCNCKLKIRIQLSKEPSVEDDERHLILSDRRNAIKHISQTLKISYRYEREAISLQLGYEKNQC